MVLCLSAACEQTLRTGKVGNTRNAPSSDGTCPTGLTVCGKGAFAQCLDLQNDRGHCGSCDNACLPGIACAAGTCQQIACTGPVTVSTQMIPDTTVTTPADEIVGALLADVNGDGHPDLVTWRNDWNTERAAGHGTFQVALGEPHGGFGAASTYQASVLYVATIVAGDSNSDGFQDLYILNEMFQDPCVEIWLGHADGKLTPKGREINGCLGSIALGDLNGDGKVDLVTAGMNAEPVVYLADANGDFHVGTSYPKGHGALTVVRDWNGDGFPDLIALGGTLGVSLNKGNGTFEDEMDCGVVASYGAVLGDFNRDGHVDVADMGNGVSVLLGMGGCQFQPMTEYALTERVDALSSGDVNGDGLEDLVAKTDDGTISLLLGGPDGVFQVVPLSVGGTPGYEEYGRLLVGDVTGDGKSDVVVVPGVFSGTQITITGDGGTVLVTPKSTAVPQILVNTCP